MQDTRLYPTLKTGERFTSPGGSFEYEVIGACCLLFDRDTLPYPCCNIGWKGKQPSWNRRGKRFIPDISTKKCENYSVKLLHYTQRKPLCWSFTYWIMGNELRRWWIDTTQREITGEITGNVDGVWSAPLSYYQELKKLKIPESAS